MARRPRRLLRKGLHRLLYTAEPFAEGLTRRARRVVHGERPPYVAPYYGYATESRVFIKARVLRGRPVRPSTAEDQLWRNVRAMTGRFLSDEAPGVEVDVTFIDPEGLATTTARMVSDEEGYLDGSFALRAPLAGGRAVFEVRYDIAGGATTTGKALAPPVGSDFIVVSDIDDTVLRTGATRKLAMFRETVTRNAWTRLPFEGVAAFYRSLQGGPSGSAHNPIFYLSSSPWNLYDFLAQFFSVHGIPEGPILLRDLGIDREKFISAGHQAHKLTYIEHLLDVYPERPFILVGDSGQDDPYIYREAVRRRPGRIRAIYIRDVLVGRKRAEVLAIADEVTRAGADMLLVADTEQAVRHAVAAGLVAREEIKEVQADKAKDEALPEPS